MSDITASRAKALVKGAPERLRKREWNELMSDIKESANNGYEFLCTGINKKYANGFSKKLQNLGFDVEIRDEHLSINVLCVRWKKG